MVQTTQQERIRLLPDIIRGAFLGDYAIRLGLWGTGDFPFATRADFVAAMAKGGVAAMEVLARDLKALGLYPAR